MALVGGTTSELSGGKFSNGAVSGAFVHMFNAELKVISKTNDNLSKRWRYKNTVSSGGTKSVNAVKVRIVLSSDVAGSDTFFATVDYSCTNCIKPPAVTMSYSGGFSQGDTFEVYIPNNEDKLNWHISIPPQPSASFLTNGGRQIADIYVP